MTRRRKLNDGIHDEDNARAGEQEAPQATVIVLPPPDKLSTAWFDHLLVIHVPPRTPGNASCSAHYIRMSSADASETRRQPNRTVVSA